VEAGSKMDAMVTISLEQFLENQPLTADMINEKISPVMTATPPPTVLQMEQKLQTQSVILGLYDCLVPGLDEISRPMFMNMLQLHFKDMDINAVINSKNQIKMVRSSELGVKLEEEESKENIESEVRSLIDAVEVVLHRKGVIQNDEILTRDVRELVQLLISNRIIAVTGHSLSMDECVKLFLEAHSLYEDKASVDYLAPLSLQPGEMFGKRVNGQWQDGVLPLILKKINRKLENRILSPESVNYIIIDGPMSTTQFKLFDSIVAEL
jgi:hypothetical protein